MANPADQRWLLVVLIYAGMAMSGAMQLLTPHIGLQLLLRALLASAAALWVRFDAHQRERPMLPIVQFVVFLTWPLAVPIYLIATRGWRGLGWSALHSVGLTMTLGVFFYTTLAVLYASGAYSTN